MIFVYILKCGKIVDPIAEAVIFGNRKRKPLNYILQYYRKYGYFLYVGITNNINVRLRQHRNKHSRITSMFNLIELIYTEKKKSRKEALEREKELQYYSIPNLEKVIMMKK